MTDKLLDDLKLALGDAYSIERELLGGGMSRVFVAMEHALGREVVIKVLPLELAAGVNRERFRREVQLAARLSHPYIVPLLHAGEHGELLWFTMPFIPGESLRTRLERTGPLSVPETLRLLHDTVEALAYAHSRGVIHRDIKPGNILSDGHHAMVTDFGVAKALSASMPMGPIAGHTTSGMAIGTPAYMAPEQLAADPSADHRVDIYAVGLLAYELLTGASPFAAASPTATMTAQLTRTPDLLHLQRPEVPPALSALVQRCLAKDQENRPVDAKSVLTDLDKISGAIAADAHRSTSGETAARALVPASPWPLLLATGAVISLVAGGVWYAQRGTPPAAPGRVDTLTVLAPRDTGASGAPLQSPASKPLTHADSLRIAQALRAELEQLDPKYKTRAVTTEAPSAEISLERQLATTDSLVRIRIAEFSSQATLRRIPGVGDAIASVGPSVAGGVGVGGKPTTGAPSAPTVFVTGPRRVMVVMSPPRGSPDPALLALNEAAMREFAKRISASGGWDVITPERVQGMRESDFSGAEALVTVGLAHTQSSADSTYLRIGIRTLTPGSSFGYRVVTSNAVLNPTNLDPFRSWMAQALEVMRDLRNLPSGATWQLDMGRFRDSIGRFTSRPRRDSTFRRPPQSPEPPQP
ncbi:MAG: serine/threonine-protein kinase [Gemmatimonadota bacterium]